MFDIEKNEYCGDKTIVTSENGLMVKLLSVNRSNKTYEPEFLLLVTGHRIVKTYIIQQHFAEHFNGALFGQCRFLSVTFQNFYVLHLTSSIVNFL